ncbi:MAG: peptide deformylase [Flavobacteriaceae bacterium]|nr:peptide deformylase [Flavobacteriaceae bacterium]
MKKIMILPILPYGNPILRAKALEINKSYPKLKDLIKNMWDTMYSANGVGLAAPQIGLSIRIFVIDTFPFSEQEELSKKESMELSTFKKVFINPKIIEHSGEDWDFNEGCLSIPDIREDISRKESIKINFLDENFVPKNLILSGIKARVVQHEYDHLEGILFTDYLSPLKKRILKKKLYNISKGKIKTDYLMKFKQEN